MSSNFPLRPQWVVELSLGETIVIAISIGPASVFIPGPEPRPNWYQADLNAANIAIAVLHASAVYHARILDWLCS